MTPPLRPHLLRSSVWARRRFIGQPRASLAPVWKIGCGKSDARCRVPSWTCWRKDSTPRPRGTISHYPQARPTPCRKSEMVSRPKLDLLAQRLDAKATWDDFVLPASETNALQEICIHARQRVQVYDVWGFGDRMNRGMGLSALFAGESGTGKTKSSH